MARHPPLTVAEIEARLIVDCEAGRCFWRDPTKYHKDLFGKEAGRARTSGGQAYWVIKLNGIPYKRSQIVLTVATGMWPSQVVDHVNGDKLDDRSVNLRHATVMQNNWNHKTRRKKASTPMGVRALPSGRFQARIAFMHRQIAIGTFPSYTEAEAAYQTKRKELFNDYA